MHLARRSTGLSFAAIGAYFGGRDPATVRHACRAAARLASDPALASAAEAIARGLAPDGQWEVSIGQRSTKCEVKRSK